MFWYKAYFLIESNTIHRYIMDATPFKQDIDELVDEFTEMKATTLADMKEVWRARKFSFIHEARPTDKNSALFMQTLYDRAISHMVGEGSLSRRLAGLYALYCLYETQLFNRPFKIYLSLSTVITSTLEDLEKLNFLVVDAKHNDVGVAVAVVKKMMAKNMFLFGFVEVDEDSVSRTVNEITKQQDAHLRVASEKLLSNFPMQEHCYMNLMEDLKLGELRNLANEYARAKELVIKEASAMQVVGELLNADTEHQAIVGEDLERIAEGWNQQWRLFYEQNGLKKPNQNRTTDDFAQELDELLSED